MARISKTRKEKRFVIAASIVLPGDGKRQNDFTITEFVGLNDRFLPIDEAALAAAAEAVRQRFARNRAISPDVVTVTTGPEKRSRAVSSGGRAPCSADEYNERRAIEYARWLAARDGIAIPHGNGPRVDWSGVNDASGKWRKRICAVEFGTSKSERHGYGRQAYTTHGWNLAARIEIPNWDFVPAEPVEEIIAEEMPLAPVALSFRIPARFLLTTCMVPVNDRLPVAPACVLRVAA